MNDPVAFCTVRFATVAGHGSVCLTSTDQNMIRLQNAFQKHENEFQRQDSIHI